MEPKRSKLFYKARERVIDEIATSMVCEMITIEGDGDLRLPESWVKEAISRRDNLIDELSQESVREDEEMGKGAWAASPSKKARE